METAPPLRLSLEPKSLGALIAGEALAVENSGAAAGGNISLGGVIVVEGVEMPFAVGDPAEVDGPGIAAKAGESVGRVKPPELPELAAGGVE